MGNIYTLSDCSAAPVGTEAGSEALAADQAPADLGLTSDHHAARPRVRRTAIESCSGFPSQNAET